MTGRTYAADLLGWLAESGGTIASFAHPEITVEIVDPERAQREVDRVRDAARARWSSVLSALVKQGRLTDDDVAGHGDPTKLLIDDDRGYTSGVARTPLPDFGQ